MLGGLRQATTHLPNSIPEANDDDVLARFTAKLPLVDRDSAWEFLDPILNNVVGWGASVEKVAGLIRRGPKGLEAMVRYLESFVVEYGISGVLLEGKIAVLMKAIEFL